MAIVRREVSDRTGFGKLVKWLFIGFNALMIFWIVAGVTSSASHAPVGEAAQAGHAVGTAIGVGLLLVLWALGDVILGIVVLLTRRKKILEVEE
ncbi:MAG: hypothetical protein QOH04_1819 [Sphingomonadales bacterium]|jgi:hypothetical protein|nr:hypothetical protein [Sphingomonadales bacterium]